MLLVTANVPSSPIIVTLMIEALSSTESSVLTRATRHDIPETTFFIVTVVKTSSLTVLFDDVGSGNHRRRQDILVVPFTQEVTGR
jgi:hypothetical protein